MPLDYRKTKFSTSAAAKKQFPNNEWPEVAIVGRSNVGKSSLLNMLCEQKNLARVSKTPGRTQLVNFFDIEQKAFLVDLPGYGFADVPAAIQKSWDDMMHDYLAQRETLLGLLLLLDIRRMPSKHDMMMYDWIAQRELPVLVVLTKTDKLGKNEDCNNTHQIAKCFDTSPKSLVSTKKKKKTGIKELRACLDDIFDDYFDIRRQIDIATSTEPKMDNNE